MVHRTNAGTGRRSTVATACLAFMLTGCSTPIVKSVVAANMAQEEAANKLLLLNIARAHEHMPMHFSLIGQIRDVPGGFGFGVPSFGIEIPFGGAAERKYSLTAGSTGQTPADVTPLTSQEFVRGMTTALKPELLAYFAQQGWSKPMLMHLFLESVDLVKEGGGDVVDRLLNDPGTATYGRFRDFVEAASTCDLVLDESASTPEFLSSVTREVSVRDGVRLHAAKLDLLRVTPKGEVEKGKDANDSHYLLASVTKVAALRFPNPPGDSKAATLCERSMAYGGSAKPAADGGSAKRFPDTLPSPPAVAASAAPPNPPASSTFGVLKMNAKKAAPESGRSSASGPAAPTPGDKADTGDNGKEKYVLEFVIRSPQSMLYYLGQLSRAQNFRWYGRPAQNGADGPLTIPVGDEQRAAMFQMFKGGDASTAAVSVAYGGQTFSVPKFIGDPKSALQDRSASVLSLMLLVMGLQDKGTEAPGVSSVRLLR